MNTRRVTCCELQGHDCDQGRKCPARAEADPMESPAIRWIAALLAVIAICAALERLGLPMEWPL
jgi:hypothetical protein